MEKTKPLVLVASRDVIWLAEIGDRLNRVNGIVMPTTSEDEVVHAIDTLSGKIDLIILEDGFERLIPDCARLREHHPALVIMGCAEDELSRLLMLDLGCNESSASLCPAFFKRIIEIVERVNALTHAN